MLSIIYRAYPNISKKTAIEFTSKDEMIEFCLDSLIKALKEIDFEFIYINDSCTENQVSIVESIFKKSSKFYKRMDLVKAGNQKSFYAQIDMVKDTKYDRILILEDDYYIDRNDILLNLEALGNDKIDYTTFYYPADADRDSGKMIKSDCLLETKNRLSCKFLPSTTLTFFCKKDIVIDDIEYFKRFAVGAHDSSLWLRLTGSFIWFLPKITRPLFRKNIKLYLSVIKRYIQHMMDLPAKDRVLIFVGTGGTTHLDSKAVNNKFNLLYCLNNKLYEFKNMHIATKEE